MARGLEGLWNEAVILRRQIEKTVGSVKELMAKPQEDLSGRYYSLTHELRDSDAGDRAEGRTVQAGWQGSPYGMLEKRAYADILLVEDNPHDVVNLLANPEKKKLKLIMTDGKNLQKHTRRESDAER